MRTSMIGAALLLAGAGAAGLAAAAADTNGNTLQLNGSDTLFDVTNEVLGTCGTTFGAGSNVTTLSYLGGGSGVGAGQMGLATAGQAISPMSRALKSTEFCTTTPTVYSGAVTAGPNKTEGLVLGIDGVAIAVNQVMSCSSSSANGFGITTPIAVLTGGNGTPTGATYTLGDPTGTMYQNQPSLDALAVLYFGLTHDGTFNCGSDTRKTLIKSWKNLFSTDCATGDTTCSAGLTHAWRRSDLSGTTDAFVSVLNPPGKGIGTLSNVPTGATKKANPFCNSFDANNAGSTSFGGSSDFQDLDPVRTICGSGGTIEGVCEATQNFATAGSGTGDLGVVLPVLLPDGPIVNHATDDYPTASCSTSCTLVAIAAGSRIPSGFKCPGGGNPIGGACYLPYRLNGTDQDPRCVAAASTRCVGAAGRPDGRVYNNIIAVNASVFTSTPGYAIYHGNKEYQMAMDANFRILNGSFFRIHSNTAGKNYAAGVGSETGTTGLCTENDDTSQIGCLADSDPCSVGYAGRESAKGYPGVDNGTGTIVPTPQPLKALAIDGTPPYTPGTDPDLALENLLVAGTPSPLYPLARRLYFNTIYGFSNLQGGEMQLAQCFGTSSISGAAISDHGFVKVPAGVQCIDYPESQPTATPAPNVNGVGNAALGGCAAAAGTNTDACTSFPLLQTDGVTPVPEAPETF